MNMNYRARVTQDVACKPIPCLHCGKPSTHASTAPTHHMHVCTGCGKTTRMAVVVKVKCDD